MSHVVASVVLDDTHLFELSIATEVFGMSRPELGPQRYVHWLCTPTAGASLGGGGRLQGTHGLEELDLADTIIFPSGPVHADPDPEVIERIVAAQARGARLVSFCSGAFMLGAAGVLDGRSATTHWAYTDDFRRRFPKVRLDPNVLFVDEGQILTSAGTAAGIDLALHIVRSDFGPELARGIARRMVVPPHRDGGQAQFIDPPHRPRQNGDGLAPLLDWLLGTLHRDVTVAEMARRAAMSERTFARRFKEATGTTPFRWLLHQRLQRAQELLETTDLTVDQIAYRSGFGTGTNLRDHFRIELGTSPTAYRRTFRCPDAAAV